MSLSAPELSAEPPEIPQMRHSVSSTELLYERAMARFYQAVEYEEKTKKNDSGRVRLGSLTESDRKQMLKKRYSDEVIDGIGLRLKKDETEMEQRLSLDEIITPSEMEQKQKEIQMFRDDILEHVENNKEKKIVLDYDEGDGNDYNSDYDEDYTESTASSDESETEKFRRAVQAASSTTMRTRHDDELDTYHPRSMQPRVSSPYQSPEPNNAVMDLVKPLPLPDPNFIPKPILKHKNENVNNIKEEKSPKSGQKKKLLKKLFDRDSNNKNSNENIEKKETKEDKKAAEQRKKLEQRQSSIEENQVAIDFYSDIVRQAGSVRTAKVPLYMNPEELRKRSGEECYSDEEIQTPSTLSPSTSQSFSPTPMGNHKPVRKLSFKDEEDQKINQLKQKHLKNNQNSTIVTQQVENERQSRSKEIETSKVIKSQVVPNRNHLDETNHIQITKPRKIRSRNPSQSPVVKNRIQLNNSETRIPGIEYRQIIQINHDLDLEETKVKIRTSMDNFTDIGLLIFAFWLYFFKDARLVIPVLAVMVYRQISDAVKEKLAVFNFKKS